MCNQCCGKSCFCFTLKTRCYFIALILLIIQSVLFDMAVQYIVKFITETTRMFYLKVNDPHLLVKILGYLVFTLVILAGAIIIVAFTVILFIGLYKENREYVKMYLIFATIMLLVFIIICVLENFFKHLDVEGYCKRSIWIILNAYFIYIIKRYWISIYPRNMKEHELNV